MSPLIGAYIGIVVVIAAIAFLGYKFKQHYSKKNK